MRITLMAAALAGAATFAAAPAFAAQGCGAGAHRNAHGVCRADYRRPVVVGAPVVRVGGPGVVLRVGGYYPGRGYWNGRRYYRTRYRYRGGWRYR